MVSDHFLRSNSDRALWTIRALVFFGLLLRLARFALRFPLWSDEAFVAAGLIGHDYVGLLKPTGYGQVCPLLFLWGERSVVDLLGFNEWTLRTLPLLCGCGALCLFPNLAKRALSGLPLILAVGILAVGIPPIRHATEAKPYAGDLFAALLLLGPAFAWSERPERTREVWKLALLTPLAVGLSYPSLFILGAIGLTMGFRAVALKSIRFWTALSCLGVSLGASVFVQWRLLTWGQAARSYQGLRDYWAASFPPLDDFGRLLRWLISTHAGSLFAYPAGGKHGASAGTLLLFLIGVVVLWKQGRKKIAGLLLLPFALAFFAACLRRYPYGGEERQMQFLAPGIAILAALGASTLINLIRPLSIRRRAIELTALALLACGIIPLVQAWNHPYQFEYDRQSRDFARRFWPEQGKSARLACLWLDFGYVGSGETHLRSAHFLSNERIYAPARDFGVVPDWDSITLERPLRCVLFGEEPANDPSLTPWLAAMRARFSLTRRDVLSIPMTGANRRAIVDRVTIYEFVPPERTIARRSSSVN
ncbi:MAG: hypothetical protein NVSMB14_06850 [Isosphaeraceae bacterium]